MAYISILPKTAQAQDRLTDQASSVMTMLHEVTREVFGVPDHDIIVELSECRTIAFGPHAAAAGATPDVVIKIATSDGDLQPRFPSLAEGIVERWNGVSGQSLKLEVWVSLIDAWSCNIDFGAG